MEISNFMPTIFFNRARLDREVHNLITLYCKLWNHSSNSTFLFKITYMIHYSKFPS
jgi:hypothetical protein